MVSQEIAAQRPNRLGVSLITFVLWGLLILGGQKIIFPNVSNLDDLVKSQVNPIFVVAIVLLLGVTFYFGWQRSVGLKAAEPPSSWRLLWLPALFILLFLGLALLLGMPPASVVVFVLINTLLVGVHEELATRGILFQGLLPSMGIWQAILLTSLLFGGVHAFNGFLTGDFAAALTQAGAAAMSGLWLMAVRLRTRSIYPAILIHGLWDFAVFVLSMAAQGQASAIPGAAAPSAANPVFALLMPLPLFLYGLWLLRGIGKQTKEDILA